MTQRIHRLFVGIAALITFTSCSVPVPTGNGVAVAGSPDVVLSDESFRCIREMTPVRGFFVGNVLGDLEATLRVARASSGQTWPPGSLVQVIPTTAMVKHQPGHNPETNDWEFIELAVTANGATILGRGFAELNMRSGLNCFNCHQPAKAAADLICEQTHGCIPIPITPAMIRGLQNTDPRCPVIELPREQTDALAELAKRSAPSTASP